MKTILGDCLEVMKTLPDKSIDMVLADPPYGTTPHEWDSVIPFEPMWAEIRRIIKPAAAVILFGQQPFFSRLVCSNIGWFKSEWIYEKSQAGGGFHARRRLLPRHENIAVFSDGSPTYNPVMELKTPEQIRRSGSVKYVKRVSGEYVNVGRPDPKNPYKFPSSIQKFDKEIWNDKVNPNGLHPTQKPIALCEYFIRTYSNRGETVLDFCMGSGSTGVACVNTGRDFIGIEKDEKYFEIANRRIDMAAIVPLTDLDEPETKEEKKREPEAGA